MFVTKSDLTRFLTLIKDGKIDLEKDILLYKDYKDYWLGKENEYLDNPEQTYILPKADWTYLKMLLDCEHFVYDKELEEKWDKEIQKLLELRKRDEK